MTLNLYTHIFTRTTQVLYLIIFQSEILGHFKIKDNLKNEEPQTSYYIIVY